MKVTGRNSQWHVVTVSWDSHPPQRKAHLRTEKEVCFLMSSALSLVQATKCLHRDQWYPLLLRETVVRKGIILNYIRIWKTAFL